MRRAVLALLALVAASLPVASQSFRPYQPGFRAGFSFLSSCVLTYAADFTTGTYSAGPPTIVNSGGYAQTVAGSWTLFPANALRRTDAGLTVEVASTNENPNSAASGASAGSPGTLPTGWGGATSANGVTRSVGGSGVEDGLDYVEMSFVGTATGTGTFSLNLQPTTSIPAATGQTWTSSLFLRSVGSPSGVAFRHTLAERNSAGTSLASTTMSVVATSSGLGSSRRDLSRTLNQATTAFTTQGLLIDYVSGASVNVTVRIGSPQLVQSVVARTPVRTTSGPVTRNLDAPTLPVSGVGRAILIFDDFSQQTFSGISTGTPWTIPAANLNRPVIRSLQGCAA